MKIADLPAKQAERYIEALQGYPPHRQLLIKVGGGLLEDKAAVLELAEALAELAEHNIHTLIIHGGGPQLSKALKRYNVSPNFIEGKRYTDEAILKLAKRTFGEISDNLVQALNDNEVKATTLPSTQLFRAKREPKFGLVGTEITRIETAKIADALKNYPVLVLHSLAQDSVTGETLNVNADTIFRALALEFQPHRITSLTPTGGVLKPIEDSDSHELISGIDIRNVETLIAEGTVSGGMALKLRELSTILNKLEIGTAISITKPSELLLELLTDQGAGTFVGKGQKIIETDDIGEVISDLSVLINEVFDKSLPDGYEKQHIEKIYYTSDRLAFGIVTKLPGGAPYLDKLAVSPQVQGRGVGESLWYRVVEDYPEIVWRSHVTNRYATWYHRHADIMKRQGEWILFGRKVDFATLEALAPELTSVPAMH